MNESPIKCPKCHSNQIASGQQGFGIGKAAVGLVALGPVGLAGGFINKNKVELRCMSCGNRWKPTPVKPPMPPKGSPESIIAGVLTGIIFLFFLICAIVGHNMP